MSLLRLLHRPQVCNACWRSSRLYASSSKPVEAVAKPTAPAAGTVPPDADGTQKSSCAEGTVLVGLSWLKNQGPVLAKADSEYPSWLWTLLQPKVLPDDGPGGKAEKVRLRKENRQRIREQNFMKTQ